jgi:dTDP-4-dehydrorhamnose reductase
MTRVVITGGGGMLGRDLAHVFADLNPVVLDRSQLDITDEQAVREALFPGDTVINAAAYTQVDRAEEEPDLAMSINGQGPRHLAQALKDLGGTLIQVSTDYVFDGAATVPYAEDFPRHPVSAYGRSKAAGEEVVLEILPGRSIIVRTAWLYGEHGNSFPKTMLALANTRETVSVVSDQVGQPTWTQDLALQIRHLVEAGVSSGIFHGTNSGQTSWWNFARAIFAHAGLDPERVLETTSAEFVRPAPRPAWSVLGHDAWKRVGIPPMRPWEEAFAEAYPICFTDSGEHA